MSDTKINTLPPSVENSLNILKGYIMQEINLTCTHKVGLMLKGKVDDRKSFKMSHRSWAEQLVQLGKIGCKLTFHDSI